MASIDDYHISANISPSSARSPRHERSKSNVFKSFLHRRNNSDGSALPPVELMVPPDLGHRSSMQQAIDFRNFSRPSALGEIQQNQMGIPSRSPPWRHHGYPSAPSSPIRNTLSTVQTISSTPSKEVEKLAKSGKNREEGKPKKTKSATNLVGFLSRPKSSKGLNKLASDDGMHPRKDKENQKPQDAARPPIYAQFSSGALEKQNDLDAGKNVYAHGFSSNLSSNMVSSIRATKQRPKSYHAYYTPKDDHKGAAETNSSANSTRGSPSKIRRGLGMFGGSAGSEGRTPSAESAEPVLDPKDIDKHLEAMLDRRNIPEHQRYKMRSLADSIKMEFIRQDWAETRGPNNVRPGSHGSDSSISAAQAVEQGKAKKSRGRSFTLSRSRKKSDASSPTKKTKGEGSIGRHFRSRSTDSVASERPPSAGSSSGTSILSKMKLHQGPLDFVTYLRKVQKPELVEVGKLHKLRLLLRNETVAWTEEFIRQGGMEEIVGLLHRIMEVEWREEHEDALLHENLLCLKALCTTALALQYLHSIQATLFPALLRMLFDPEKKGPSEFTTRNIITSVLFTYIQSAPAADRPVRAKTVLGHLRDPEPKEDQRPLGFVLEMRRDRPYRVWCKEAVSVTKEVFWIFLHHLNVVYLPREKETREGAGPSGIDSAAYMQAHFPQERPPVPAAPYVGGVEWDATNYLASHLDLLNAILACTPTAGERNALREQFQISGWERCLGGSLRLCKEKFYPGVHDALRTWVAAAAEDGWDVKGVRYGPPAEPKPPRKQAGGGGGGGGGGAKAKPKEEPAPKIEIPKLSFGLAAAHGPASPAARTSGNWLS
ncbi:armadillo-type protein [Durotheca rogersii]|uniref:armadillo-type protein n=1 Tax=Durotheca rogersii TaxID=419775 RepID=UPI00221EDFA2|nr:armadillo-type protein [Durotheca rogersii]KAI5866240.1 armadillo-type protein [Durotheca rogersii]